MKYQVTIGLILLSLCSITYGCKINKEISKEYTDSFKSKRMPLWGFKVINLAHYNILHNIYKPNTPPLNREDTHSTSTNTTQSTNSNQNPCKKSQKKILLSKTNTPIPTTQKQLKTHPLTSKTQPYQLLFIINKCSSLTHHQKSKKKYTYIAHNERNYGHLKVYYNINHMDRTTTSSILHINIFLNISDFGNISRRFFSRSRKYPNSHQKYLLNISKINRRISIKLHTFVELMKRYKRVQKVFEILKYAPSFKTNHFVLIPCTLRTKITFSCVSATTFQSNILFIFNIFKIQIYMHIKRKIRRSNRLNSLYIFTKYHKNIINTQKYIHKNFFPYIQRNYTTNKPIAIPLPLLSKLYYNNNKSTNLKNTSKKY